jgi:hypothetical protein
MNQYRKALCLVPWTMAAAIQFDSALGQDLFIDQGACPGEGCVYDEPWVAEAPIELHAAADLASAVVAKLDAGDSVWTLTGEVHTLVPGIFQVVHAFDDFAPGDEVQLYTYRGEGWFHVRHNGVLKDADLSIGPTEPDFRATLQRCTETPYCHGALERAPEYEWWIKVRTASGIEGWVAGPQSFDTPSHF